MTFQAIKNLSNGTFLSCGISSMETTVIVNISRQHG